MGNRVAVSRNLRSASFGFRSERALTSITSLPSSTLITGSSPSAAAWWWRLEDTKENERGREERLEAFAHEIRLFIFPSSSAALPYRQRPRRCTKRGAAPRAQRRPCALCRIGRERRRKGERNGAGERKEKRGKGKVAMSLLLASLFFSLLWGAWQGQEPAETAFYARGSAVAEPIFMVWAAWSDEKRRWGKRGIGGDFVSTSLLSRLCVRHSFSESSLTAHHRPLRKCRT